MLDPRSADKPACKWRCRGANLWRMATTAGPVTLTAEQVEEINRRLGVMRHDINNNLSLIVAAAELIKFNPETAQRMANTLAEQPPKITDHIQKFCTELEKALGILRT